MSTADALTHNTATLSIGRKILIMALRLVVGAMFIISGFVKMIDIYGFIFKIEEYVAVWGMSVPRSVILLGAMALCAVEFVGGCLLVTGMLKRVATWMLTLLMAAMTMLTAWIYIADPVSDCGCFGDFLILSNGATFIKNIILLVALLYLSRNNSRLNIQLLHPSIQWLGITLLTLYIAIIGLYGYNIEPMLDFRPYPVGTDITSTDSDDNEEDTPLMYRYAKDGVEQTFSIYALPDSTWTFVDAVTDSSATSDETSTLTIYDIDGDDVTADVLDGQGRQLLLVIPEPSRMDISYTFELNELNEWAETEDIHMAALLAANRRGIDYWLDMSMATYPCYSVEDTKLKELSRGIMSLVYIEDGTIVFKRNLSSITADDVNNITSGSVAISDIAPATHTWLTRLTILLLAALTLIYMLQDAITRLIRRLCNLDKKLSHKESAADRADMNDNKTQPDKQD